MVRTRFAPSPTGLLHIGGVRTALFNYLFAKQNQGSFILRLEDTDRERFVAEGVDQIVAGLDWVGLRPDEGFWITEGKPHSIDYIQSERHKSGIYQKYADQLIEKGLAYRSYISADGYEKYKDRSIKKGVPFIYRKTYEAEYHHKPRQTLYGDWPIRLDIEAVKGYFSEKKHPFLHERVDWDDEVRGAFSDDLSLMEDFIIIKSDGFPTYNFANVIDDHFMKISHIIRGDEFISSTGKHALLYEIFGCQSPKFVHLPVINGLDGKKLSKRTGDTDVLDYKEKGYLPEALVNFLALLGWNDGTEQEIFKHDELVQKFKLDQINTSPAVFDPKRLDWMNGYYIRSLSVEELYKRAADFWTAKAETATDSYKKRVLSLVQERLKFLAELATLTIFFFEAPSAATVRNFYKNPVDKQLIKNTPDLRHFLSATVEQLKDSDFSHADIQNRLNKLLKKLGTKPAILFPVIRIALTGSSVSPEIFGTIEVLGRNESLKRLDAALTALNQGA